MNATVAPTQPRSIYTVRIETSDPDEQYWSPAHHTYRTMAETAPQAAESVAAQWNLPEGTGGRVRIWAGDLTATDPTSIEPAFVLAVGRVGGLCARCGNLGALYALPDPLDTGPVCRTCHLST